jgi:Zn-finger nucleic acid-binding protein
MTDNRIVVRTREVTEEDLYFLDQDKKKIQQLREKAARESDEAYRGGHRNHCFRCGTPTLVEVDHKGVKIDLCVNDRCGAVHLDPGEMEKVLDAGKGLFNSVKRSFARIFKDASKAQ